MADNGRSARTTIEDVARVAGVSTATASRVLARSAPVSEPLQKRVLAAAETLGYRVNRAARALRRDRTSTVGMVVPDLSNPFFTLLIDGIERRLQQLDISLLVCSSHGDPDLERQRLQSLLSSRVDVLVVVPVDASASGTALRTGIEEVPVIQLDQFADGVDADWVGTDEGRGMELIVTHLTSQGVRSAAFIGALTTDSSSRARYEKVRALCQRHGVDLSCGDELLGSYSTAWGAEAAERLISEGQTPEAIICGADVIALGVLQALDAAELAVPSDVLVTGFDDIALSAHPRLAITTVRQPIDEIAQKTVDLVIDITNTGTEHQRGTYALEPELVVRTSSMRARSTPAQRA